MASRNSGMICSREVSGIFSQAAGKLKNEPSGKNGQ